jgi:two-component sensor histidine kinase
LKFRTKLIITFFLFVALLGIVLIVFIRGVLSRELTTELQKRGVGITKHFAEMATDHVLTEDAFSLKMLAVDHKDTEENIEYIFIMDTNGMVLAHTFGDGFPVELRTANTIRPEQEFNVQILNSDNKSIFDIAVPILKGAAGTVRIGISAEPIREEVDRLTRLTVLIIVLVLLLGIIVASSLTIAITKPITELEKATHAIGGGDLKHRVHVRTNDELGQLSETFNMMAENLQKTDGELKQSLHDKELLMKEIHHRVRNNLVVISSLLRLQSGQIEDEESREYFIESQNRVKAMAMIHEKLYRSADFSNVKFSEYLRELASQLFETYSVNAAKVRLDMDIPDITTDIDTMIPSGLIVNELVSNAFKYAFPDDREGQLSIVLAKGGDDECTLVIRDNGVGLPEGLDLYRTDTMGMNLVTSLVAQIKGKLELVREGGTEFRITFKRKRFEE